MFQGSLNYFVYSAKLIVNSNYILFLRCCSFTRNTKISINQFESVKDKIIYNSKSKRIIDTSSSRVGNTPKSSHSHLPAFLQLFKEFQAPVQVSLPQEDNEPVFPLKLTTDSSTLDANRALSENYVDIAPSKNDLPEANFYIESEIKKSVNWMNDYEKYCEETEENINSYVINYGTPNRSVPVSNSSCGGCGSYLQCQEPSLPGYLPSEIYLGYKNKELNSALCQRCHFFQNYNIALSVQVEKDMYNNILSAIRQKSLVILLVDLTDFPCSIWPGIMDLLGPNRPLFIVGNKVDLLWGDRKGWLRHVETLLNSYVPKAADVLHTCLISAKTGYGVENLVSELHSKWKYKGDVYLVGCTNVGKSTLFNALLQSDYCKTKAVDLTQRATTAPWPGTTLNLLRFPILRPKGWKIFLRNQRLSLQRHQAREENKLKLLALRAQKKKPDQPVQLIENVIHTFSSMTPNKEDNSDALQSSSLERSVRERVSLLSTDITDFKESKWFYDTPGVVHSDQILDMLTTEELIMTIPKKIILPRSYRIVAGWAIFIAGLSRLDYVQGTLPIKLTVFASDDLPITICSINDADEVYHRLLGSDQMAVPCGNQLRLNKWPGLEQSSPILLTGEECNVSCADIVLSSSGWISVTPSPNELCELVPWTPSRKGIHVRVPSILPWAIKLKGKRIRMSPAYGTTKPAKL